VVAPNFEIPIPAQAIPVFDMKRLHGFELSQKLARRVTIVSVTLKLGDQLLPSRDAPFALGDGLFCLCEVFFPERDP